MTEMDACKAQEVHRPAPSSPNEVIRMLNRTEIKKKKKTLEGKQQGMTQHKTLHSKNNKATQTKNHIRTTALVGSHHGNISEQKSPRVCT